MSCQYEKLRLELNTSDKKKILILYTSKVTILNINHI